MSSHEATLTMFAEYLICLEECTFHGPDKCSATHLRWMCREALANPGWPIDKLSRWLGFVQAILIINGKTTVDIERDRTRPLFTEVKE